MAPVYSDHGYGGGTFVFREGLGRTTQDVASRSIRIEARACCPRERTKRMSKYHALAERDIERLAKDWITQNPHQALRLSVDAHKNWHRCVCALHHLSIDESGRVVLKPP